MNIRLKDIKEVSNNFKDEFYNFLIELLSNHGGFKIDKKNNEDCHFNTKNNSSLNGNLRIHFNKNNLIDLSFEYNMWIDTFKFKPFYNEIFDETIVDGRSIFLEYFNNEIDKWVINKLTRNSNDENDYLKDKSQKDIDSINLELCIWNKCFKKLNLIQSKENYYSSSRKIVFRTNFSNNTKNNFIIFEVNHENYKIEKVSVRKIINFFKEKFEDRKIKKNENTGYIKLPFIDKSLLNNYKDLDSFSEDDKIILTQIIEVNNNYHNIVNEIFEEEERKILEEKRKIQIEKDLKKKEKIEKEREILNKKNEFLLKFDKDSNGKIDIIEEGIYYKLLKKHQLILDNFHSEGVYHLVKLNNIIKQKEDILSELLTNYKKQTEIESVNQLEKTFEYIFKEYSVIIFNGVNMIMSVINKDKITYYEIYDKFESLGIFQNSYEKNVISNGKNIISELKNTNLQLKKLDSIIYELREIENTFHNELSSLNYTLDSSFTELTSTLNTELKGINKSIEVGNFIGVLNTYQTYKLNSNFKKLLS